MRGIGKLKFKAGNGHPFFACRVLELDDGKIWLKKGMLGFKEKGKPHDISYDSNYAELSQTVCELLSVERQFVDEVVFAHQGQSASIFGNIKKHFFELFKLHSVASAVEGFE
jgi:hypothetical protein